MGDKDSTENRKMFKLLKNKLFTNSKDVSSEKTTFKDEETSSKNRKLEISTNDNISVTKPQEITIDEADAEITSLNLYASTDFNIEDDDMGVIFGEENEEDTTDDDVDSSSNTELQSSSNTEKQTTTSSDI